MQRLFRILLMLLLWGFVAGFVVFFHKRAQVHHAQTILQSIEVDIVDSLPDEMLISTDTVENPYAAMSDKVRIVSAAPLFAEAVQRIHRGESVSPMFTQIPLKVIESLQK